MGRDGNVYLLGPGEAKNELCKRMEKEGLSPLIAGIESEELMTDRQIIARVKELYNRVPARSY
jgi:hypothetical protein